MLFIVQLRFAVNILTTPTVSGIQKNLILEAAKKNV